MPPVVALSMGNRLVDRLFCAKRGGRHVVSSPDILEENLSFLEPVLRVSTLRRFPKAREFAAWLGLIPRLRGS